MSRTRKSQTANNPVDLFIYFSDGKPNISVRNIESSEVGPIDPKELDKIDFSKLSFVKLDRTFYKYGSFDNKTKKMGFKSSEYHMRSNSVKLRDEENKSTKKYESVDEMMKENPKLLSGSSVYCAIHADQIKGFIDLELVELKSRSSSILNEENSKLIKGMLIVKIDLNSTSSYSYSQSDKREFQSFTISGIGHNPEYGKDGINFPEFTFEKELTNPKLEGNYDFCDEILQDYFDDYYQNIDSEYSSKRKS